MADKDDTVQNCPECGKKYTHKIFCKKQDKINIHLIGQTTSKNS